MWMRLPTCVWFFLAGCGAQNVNVAGTPANDDVVDSHATLDVEATRTLLSSAFAATEANRTRIRVTIGSSRQAPGDTTLIVTEMITRDEYRETCTTHVEPNPEVYDDASPIDSVSQTIVLASRAWTRRSPNAAWIEISPVHARTVSAAHVLASGILANLNDAEVTAEQVGPATAGGQREYVITRTRFTPTGRITSPAHAHLWVGDDGRVYRFTGQTGDADPRPIEANYEYDNTIADVLPP